MDMIIIQLLLLLAFVFFISWIFITVIVYFIPTIIAVIRKHENTLGICILNIFLGWTVLGWIASLLWALNGDVKKEEETQE